MCHKERDRPTYQLIKMEVVPPPSQQYCLKWNNHSHNISGVFDRSRGTNDFVDVTLATADHQTIDCHKLLLSAGSR